MRTSEGHLTFVDMKGVRDKVVGEGFLEEIINLNHILIKETTWLAMHFKTRTGLGKTGNRKPSSEAKAIIWNKSDEHLTKEYFLGIQNIGHIPEILTK